MILFNIQAKTSYVPDTAKYFCFSLHNRKRALCTSCKEQNNGLRIECKRDDQKNTKTENKNSHDNKFQNTLEKLLISDPPIGGWTKFDNQQISFSSALVNKNLHYFSFTLSELHPQGEQV